jgi:hypothetical protein
LKLEDNIGEREKSEKENKISKILSNEDNKRSLLLDSISDSTNIISKNKTTFYLKDTTSNNSFNDFEKVFFDF